MVEGSDTTPLFTATRGTSDHETFDLEDHLGDGPTVLALFPGAFTPPCTNEMVALQDDLGAFQDAGATVFGVSADPPFSQGAFRDERGIESGLASDVSGDVTRQYGLEFDVEELGLYGIANRAVFVLDETGTVTYRWIADNESRSMVPTGPSRIGSA